MPAATQARASSDEDIERIYCLSGCTAVGKTELALLWAEANQAEIVSCDSLLFYRGMDIGTAKPTPAEQARVPHHLIDILEPDQQMHVGAFVDLATDTIRRIQARGRRVLVTGGSGFYLKAFFEPVVDEVAVSPATRAEVAGYVDEGLEIAVAQLRIRNPNGLGSLDVKNPRRVLKALERCIETGATLAELKEAFARQRNALVDANKRLTLLERDSAELNERIARRVEQMLQAGLVEEVQGLLDRGVDRSAGALNSIGYRETIAYLEGEYDLGELKERITVNTRRLAKKQRTWFRGQLPADARRVALAGELRIDPSSLFSA